MLVPTREPDPLSKPTRPAYLKLQRAFFAACLILWPLLMFVEVLFNPARNAVNGTGSAAIAANTMAWASTVYPLRVFLVVIAAFIVPFAVLGMTQVTMRRSPWLATIGGFLTLTGGVALIVFAGQDDLTYLMAQMGGGPQLAALWDRFNTDPLMTAYLYMVILGYFLVGPLLLAIGLGRGHLIPTWAVWVLILRTPVQIVGFVAHIGLSIELVTSGLLLIGVIPVALALLKLSDEETPAGADEQPASTT